MQLFTGTNIVVAVALAYIAIASHQLYKMMNPLSGIVVDPSTPVIGPLWAGNQSFCLICFLSTSADPMRVYNVDKIRDSGQLLYESPHLVHSASQQLVDIELLLVHPASNRSTHQHFTRTQSLPANTTNTSEQRPAVQVYPSKAIWRRLLSNQSSVFMHVLLVASSNTSHQDPSTTSGLVVDSRHIQEGAALHGAVQLVKYDKVPKHFRHRYLMSDLGLVTLSPEDERRLSLPVHTVVSFWKPEVAIRLVNDFTEYPYSHVPHAIDRDVVYKVKQPSGRSSTGKQSQRFDGRVHHPSSSYERQGFYRPAVFVDEIGLTSDKYVVLNETVQELPLKISFGPLSLQRWLLVSTLEESLASQRELGFTAKDLDDVRRLISETSLYLLAITVLASLLHLLFEFLALRSDISFWQGNKSLAGLSARTVVTDLVSQAVVFLFLLDSDTSLLVTVPTFFAILIQVWKVYKATGPTIEWGGGTSWPAVVFRRWTDDVAATAESQTTETSAAENQLTKVTLEADRFATQYLTRLLTPLVALFALRSLLYEQHSSWYSWAIGACTGCVYSFGFVLMCPQLYINHQLKSVSHLPWKYLVYKFLNTFIDDLFAFIIKMPTMHRLSVFRDDIVFVIYLYQRWIYRVDETRPSEK